MTMNCVFSCHCQGLSPMNVRYLYAAIFLLSAWIFLVVQLISFMRFITRLNYKLCQTNYQGRYLVVFGISIFANIGSTGLIIFMIVKLRHYWLDIEFLGTTLVLVYIMCALSLISKANKLFMEPGIICGYILFLLPVSDYKLWNIIESEDDVPYGLVPSRKNAKGLGQIKGGNY
ncbi:hypothetical protein Zm00014a_023393 [Zea mays]|uniref:Uncharacterized protein n=1 Tax=Zea mays TaxID=4577 RepID=A0A3L6EEV9_MAIZE|nr:hypothetical protein Zm00014a_023393 [Zea mays]